jgi:Flp pilus assembly protein TadD
MVEHSLTDDQMTLLHLLAYISLQNARPDRAVVLFDALEVLRPDRPEWLRGLAIAHLRKNTPQQALDALDRLAMSSGVDATFHLLRAQALVQLERNDEAALAMRSYLQLRGS